MAIFLESDVDHFLCMSLNTSCVFYEYSPKFCSHSHNKILQTSSSNPIKWTAKTASASTRRRTKQCRSSCEDIIISAARGGIVDDSSTHRNGDYDESRSLASSAVDALFHWQQQTMTATTASSSASSTPNNPYEQQRYEDFVLYPFRRAVYEYIQQAGQIHHHGRSSSSHPGPGLLDSSRRRPVDCPR